MNIVNILMKYMPDLSSVEKSGDWILSQRPPKNHVNLWQPYAYLIEEERSSKGTIDKIATLFLTNKECPFRCLMCDLWKNTTDEKIPPGVIPDQIQWALQRLPRRFRSSCITAVIFLTPKR